MQRHARLLGLLALVGLASVAAACTPQVASPPAATSCAGQAQAQPTPQRPVEYVAVVDTPGPGQPDVVTFTASSNIEKDAKVDDLADDGRVVAVEPNGEVSAQAAPVDPDDDPLYVDQWGPAQAQFPDPGAWATYSGTNVRIAIVDSGVRASHEDLTPRVVTGQDFVSTADPDGVAGGTTDDFGHGTHVAGIAAASDNTVGVVGAAPDATVVPVKVLNSSGSGSFDAVARGINWAADPSKGNADVINLSLGGGGCSASIGTAVSYAKSQNVIVVAAAGNNSSTAAFSPASFDNEVIAVAATTVNDTKSSYSNYGSYVDIGAPGDAIRSTLNGTDTQYGDKSGTSMASPLVAGAVALYREKCPNASFATVRTALVDSATVQVAGYAFKRLDAAALTATAC